MDSIPNGTAGERAEAERHLRASINAQFKALMDAGSGRLALIMARAYVAEGVAACAALIGPRRAYDFHAAVGDALIEGAIANGLTESPKGIRPSGWKDGAA